MKIFENSKNSLTLVELIVVIIIIGIIFTFAIPTYRNAREKAQDKEAKSQLKLIQDAEAMKRLQINSYVSCVDNTECSNSLDLDLELTSAPWEFSVVISDVPPDFCAQAELDSRSWHINKDDDEALKGVCSGF